MILWERQGKSEVEGERERVVWVKEKVRYRGERENVTERDNEENKEKERGMK